MRRAAFMRVHAVVALVFGTAFVLAPAPALALYGAATDAAGTFVSRLFGAAMIQIGLVAWLARTDSDTVARRAVQLGYTAGIAVGLIVALLGQLAGLFNAFGWATVAIYLLMAAGYGYFYARPAAA